MGCYDVSCAVSGLTIGYEDRAYIIPLMPENCQLVDLDDQRFHVHKQDGRGDLYSESHFTYSDDLYQPWLPILGSYNDYGRLEQIEENDYTRFLENWFGIAIEDIVEAITMGNKYDNRRRREVFDGAKTLEGKKKQRFDILDKLSAMFIHKDIYDYLACQNQTLWGWRSRISLSDAYDKLHKAIVTYDKPLPDETLEEKAKKSLRSLFDDPMRSDRPPKDEDGYHLGHFLSHRWYTAKVLLRDFIKKGQLKKEICNFIQFDANLDMCNRLYFPGASGGQGNDDTTNIGLYKTALKIIGNKVLQLSEENITEDTKCKFCKQMKTKYLEDSCRECHLQYCEW